MGLSWEGGRKEGGEGERGGREGERGKWEGERGKGEGERGKGEGDRGEGVKRWKMAGNLKKAGNLKLVAPKIVWSVGACGSFTEEVSEQQSTDQKSTRQGSNLRLGDLQSLALPLSYWWLTKGGEKPPNKG